MTVTVCAAPPSFCCQAAGGAASGLLSVTHAQMPGNGFHTPVSARVTIAMMASTT